jgi:hypothetical protein
MSPRNLKFYTKLAVYLAPRVDPAGIMIESGVAFSDADELSVSYIIGKLLLVL